MIQPQDRGGAAGAFFNSLLDAVGLGRLVILQLFLVVIVDVHIPDAVRTPDIAAVKLCKLLQPISVIETQ